MNVESLTPDADLDVSDPLLFEQDIWGPRFRLLRRERPVNYCHASPYGPYWSITRFEDVQEVELDHLVFSSDSSRGGIRIDNRLRDSFISRDPPRHTIERRTIAPVAAPTNLASYEIAIRERTRQVLSELPRGETFDWVERVSIELTTLMLATLFDFPLEDRKLLTYWSDVATSAPEFDSELVQTFEQRTDELKKMARYMGRLWNERVNAPPSSDLISMLAHDPTTRNMSPIEFMGNCILLIVGGNDTTRNSMSGGLLAMCQNPAEWAKRASRSARATRLSCGTTRATVTRRPSTSRTVSSSTARGRASTSRLVSAFTAV